MKAFIVTAPRRFGLADIPEPRPANDEILVRVAACGICGSDLDIIEGTRPMEVTAYPVVLGHEFAGEVFELGREVRGLRPGQKVAVDTIVRCQTCPHCALGWGCHCENGFNQLGCTMPGGMAEYVAVPRHQLYPLPDRLDLAEAALAEPASCAAHGVSKAEIRPGDSVAVVGAGAIGALALQIARLFSPAHLISVDIDPRKAKLARKLGASHTVEALSEDEVVAQIMEITQGRGVQAVIECTGSLSPIQQSFRYVATKGKIVVIGVPPQTKFEIDYLTLLLKDATFRPSNGYTTSIWLWVLQLLASGAIDTRTIITHRLGLSGIERGFAILRERVEPTLKVMASPKWNAPTSGRRVPGQQKQQL
jgi:2-desacetyl-2-hydroxyethyl bacteriochlorophyllide A dehydrogenase